MRFLPASQAMASSRNAWRDRALIALAALGSGALCLLVAAASRFGAASDGSLGTLDLRTLAVGWDSGWYLRIVANGYEPWSLPDAQLGTTPHAFFPVFPMIVRGVVLATGLEPVTAGVLASTALFVLALVLVHAWVRAIGLAREVALATVLLLACAPHGFVFFAFYPESAFLFLLAAAMLALERRAFAWAGLAAALLSATRPNGVLFVVYALAWTLQTSGWRPLARPWTEPGPMLTIVLAPLGLVAYWWFCFLTTGDAFAMKTTQVHGWYWEIDWPWRNLALHLRGSSTDRFWAWGSLLYFAASLLLLRWRMVAAFAFCLASFLLVWSNVHPPSLIRYAVVLFPIHVALARACEGNALRLAALAAGFAALNAFLVVAFVHQWRIAV